MLYSFEEKSGRIAVLETFSGRRIGGQEALVAAETAGYDIDLVDTSEVAEPKRRKTIPRPHTSTRSIVFDGM